MYATSEAVKQVIPRIMLHCTTLGVQQVLYIQATAMLLTVHAVKIYPISTVYFSAAKFRVYVKARIKRLRGCFKT